MSPSCQSPHTDVSRSVKNKKKHYACKIHIAGEIFFVIQMAFHIILPSSFKKPCRMWLQKMTSILSKCLFSQVAEMTWPLRHPFKSCFRTRSQWCWCALGSWQPPGGKNGANLCHREVHATIGAWCLTGQFLLLWIGCWSWFQRPENAWSGRSCEGPKRS